MLTDIDTEAGTIPDPSQVIVSPPGCSRRSYTATCAHHRAFPEIHAEGSTIREAVEQLLAQLGNALESVGSLWHRDNVRRAIADVRAFFERET